MGTPLRGINTFPQVDNCRQVGDTSAMKIAVHLARHRRLAAWVGLSLLLHLFALVLIDGLWAPAPAVIGTPVALRLVRARPDEVAPAALPPPAPAPVQAAAEAPALPPSTPIAPASNAAADTPAAPPPAATSASHRCKCRAATACACRPRPPSPMR